MVIVALDGDWDCTKQHGDIGSDPDNWGCSKTAVQVVDEANDFECRLMANPSGRNYPETGPYRVRPSIRRQARMRFPVTEVC